MRLLVRLSSNDPPTALRSPRSDPFSQLFIRADSASYQTLPP